MTSEVNGSADVEHLVSAAKDALSDDIVARVAQTASDGMDLIDEVNRSGLKKALPALAALVENGDLDRMVKLARVYGAAEDALSDDIIGRLAATTSEGLDLVDQLNSSGIKSALPAVANLVANGDLDRIVKLARVYGAAEDALSDEIIGRMAETLSEGMGALDRFNRGGGARLVSMLERMEASGSLEKLADSLPRLIDRLEQVERLLIALDVAENQNAQGPRAKGGIGGLISMLSNADNQESLRHLMNLGKALGK